MSGFVTICHIMSQFVVPFFFARAIKTILFIYSLSAVIDYHYKWCGIGKYRFLYHFFISFLFAGGKVL